MSKWDLDLSGQNFGRWTVLERSERYYWKCKCECGEIKDIYYTSLLNEKSRSCLSCASKTTNNLQQQNKIGLKFGRLTIIGVARIVNNKCIYKCRCDCNAEVDVPWGLLQSGRTSSCGCLRDELRKNGGPRVKSYDVKTRANYLKEGTSLVSIGQKVSKNSSTGVKGVSRMKDGRYRAYLNFKGKHVHLGIFGTLKEAENARSKGEKKYYKPLLEKYKDVIENTT